jgi:hypothetical protein
MAFLTQTTASFCKNLIVTFNFENNANTFAEKWQKSQKIASITSTPGLCTNFYNGFAKPQNGFVLKNQVKLDHTRAKKLTVGLYVNFKT